MSEYSQGIYQDGAAILKDGRMMTIEEIIAELNNHEKLVEALEECRDAMEAFNRAPGATRDEWEFECEVKEIDAILATMEAEKGVSCE